jgi:hypothetical protein
MSRRYPRKLKKQILGTKMSKNKLESLLSNVTFVEDKEYHHIAILPFTFCPFCGCRSSYDDPHYADYPEVWVEDRCCRCHRWVGGADNSYYHHILEDLFYGQVIHER